MCGRFSIVDDTRKVEKRFGVKYVEYQTEPGPVYNAAPSMLLPIIVNPFSAGGERKLVLARWGLEAITSRLLPMPNARIETAATKRMFKDAFEQHHCLVPANSYYEWKRTKWIKQPYRILLKDESLFAIAGIFQQSRTADPHPTFALLTTSSTPLLKKIHDRMPVILRRDQEQLWLKVAQSGTFYTLEDHYPEEEMTLYPVTKKMNHVAFNNPEAWMPIEEPTLGI